MQVVCNFVKSETNNFFSMNYRLTDYIFYLYYILAIAFLFLTTKVILKNRYQKTKYLNLKAIGIVLIIELPLIFLMLCLVAWYLLKDQPF